MAKRKLSEFRPAQINANRHSVRGLALLDDSMSADGFVGPITVAADGEALRNDAQAIAKFWSKVDRSGGATSCWLWKKGRFDDGYGHYAICRNGRIKSYRAHRYAYLIERGDIPSGALVCHRCDVPLCCNPSHLWLGSPAENIQDAQRKGRLATGLKNGAWTKPMNRASNGGERNGQAKLTADIVGEIRKRYAGGGVQQGHLAKEYGVSFQLIHLIVRGKIWKESNGAGS
jgi:hypothetical protein